MRKSTLALIIASSTLALAGCDQAAEEPEAPVEEAPAPIVEPMPEPTETAMPTDVAGEADVVTDPAMAPADVSAAPEPTE